MKPLALAAALGLLAGAADAAITFDLTGRPASDEVSYVFTEGGIGLTVTAVRNNPNSDDDDDVIRVTQNRNGLGATFDGDDRLALDGDNVGVDEFLIFTFDQLVKAGSVFFSPSFGPNDDADIYVDDGSGTFALFEDDAKLNPYLFGWLEVARIAIGADETNDIFRVKELTVAAVPVPAAGLLLAGALGGLALARRRRA